MGVDRRAVLEVGAAHDHRDVEGHNHVPRHLPRRPNDHLVDVATREHAESSLVQIHNREVPSAVVVDLVVTVHADNQEVALFPRLFEAADMSSVEQIKGSVDINNAVIWFRDPVVAELRDAASGGQEGGGGGRDVVLRRAVRRPSAHLLALVVVLGHEEHATNQIRGAHTLGSLDRLVPSHVLCHGVDVLAVGREARVVAVDDVVDLVLVEEAPHPHVVEHVRHVRNALVDPLAGRHSLETLCVVHDRRATLVLLHLAVGVESNHKHVAHRPCLAESIGVAKVEHVEAAVHPDAHRPASRQLADDMVHDVLTVRGPATIRVPGGSHPIMVEVDSGSHHVEAPHVTGNPIFHAIFRVAPPESRILFPQRDVLMHRDHVGVEFLVDFLQRSLLQRLQAGRLLGGGQR
mmetsp:Transcript_27692/g.63775  ORF Transcript_27692/g.63775 Transcript_27692/m.63775 type:complete len:405 (-) Transcript_27692:747-1961(-)